MENNPTAYEVFKAQSDKIIELIRASQTQKVDVTCECDTEVELEHTCNSEEDEPCAACESLGRWDYPTRRYTIE